MAPDLYERVMGEYYYSNPYIKTQVRAVSVAEYGMLPVVLVVFDDYVEVHDKGCQTVDRLYYTEMTRCRAHNEGVVNIMASGRWHGSFYLKGDQTDLVVTLVALYEGAGRKAAQLAVERLQGELTKALVVLENYYNTGYD